jgi:hypothetical protein
MATLSGFAPNAHRGAQNAVGSLTVEVSAGVVNGVSVLPQGVTLANIARTQYVYVDNSGNLFSTLTFNQVINLIATVVTGLVTVSGTLPSATGSLSGGNTTNLTQVNAIISITDNRTWK